ncbi:MAG: hypothetical protein ABI554_02275 [Flavobacterium sp.]
MTGKPRVNSAGEKELDRIAKQCDEFHDNIKEMTMDRMSDAPKQEVEPQTKLSQKDLAKSKDIYLKPKRTIGVRDKFNEDYRSEWEFAKEYVHFIAEHKEIIGETIDMWTKPFAGVPAEWWEIPTNKPVWAPRYVAEQLKGRNYHRLIMNSSPVENNQYGQIYGQMAIDTTIQRLDAIPVSSRRSVFMGA